MYLPIDYNCFVNQLYEDYLQKKKQGDFNFAL
jgi:hypothetical protein